MLGDALLIGGIVGICALLFNDEGTGSERLKMAMATFGVVAGFWLVLSFVFTYMWV